MSGVVLLCAVVFTGLFVVLMLGLCRASSKQRPAPCVLTAEERAQWDLIERYW